MATHPPLDRLERLVSVRSLVTVPRLRLDPMFDPLRESPQCQALLAD